MATRVNPCTNLYRFIRLCLGDKVSDREISRRWAMEWKSFIALKQGRRQMPRIGDLERLATILGIDAGYVFQVARGSPPKDVAALLGRESELRALLDRVADGVFTMNRDGQLRDVNAGFADMLGVKPSELLGRSLVDIVSSDAVPRALEIVSAARRGTIHRTQLDFAGARGERRTAEIDAVPIRDAAGATIGAQALARDVTDQRKLIQDLAENRALLMAIFDHVPAACIVFEADGTISAANPLVESVCPFTAHELVGKKATDVFGDPGPVGCPVTRAFQMGTVEQQVSWMTNRAGRRTYVHRTAGPIRHGESVVRVIEIMVDVTDQIQQGDLRVLSFWRGLPEDLSVAGNSERRAAPRATVSFAATMRLGRRTVDVVARNLGAGGMFVETDAHVRVGARIELSWTLPVDHIPVHARAVAVWTRRRDNPAPGIGVRFTELQPRHALKAS